MSLSKLARQLSSKPATAPDGLHDNEASSNSPVKAAHSGSLLSDLVFQAKGGHLGADAKAIVQGVKAMSSGKPINDRELLLEHGVGLLQHLPPDSQFGYDAANGLIGMLWRDLPHPPASIVTPTAAYRCADGGGNNPFVPEMGRAGGAYSRSVPAVRPKPANLPDPGLVFDLLLRRHEFKPHPSGLSSFFFNFATCVIHECFQTNARNWWINDTSSYVDLSTVYGNNQDEQDAVRTKDGRGTLWPDTISSLRIMLMPPAVAAILVLFSRNHNFIANRILTLNERGWYNSDVDSLVAITKSTTASPADVEKAKALLIKQDEDVFQLARNVNVAFFAKVVLGDYVAAILNTPRSGSEWSLDLGGEIRQKDGSMLNRGGGNVVSVEFNVLYHWHASLSEKDAAWTSNVFQKEFPDKPLADLTPGDFYTIAGKLHQSLGSKPPKEWSIAGLQRGPDGRYPDAALAELIKDAIDEPAAAFGANGSPEVLKVVEILGQRMARESWGVCTMNEFRKYLNLTPFRSFHEWNPDPIVAKAAETLYGHIDDLELYPGLLAEEAKKAMIGSGVCPGHTIGRGILDDAVSLIRSDRFLTHDLNTTTLTSWGMAALKPCPGTMGGIFGTVLFNALPNAFEFNSTYVLFPFYTPHAAREILTMNKTLSKYTTTRGPSDATLQCLKSFKACKEAFLDRDVFRVFYNENIKQVTGNRGFMIGFDDKARHDPPSDLFMAAFHGPNFERDISAFFSERVDYQLKKCSLAFAGSTKRQIDLVRDVTNVVPIEWVADRFAIPLKTVATPRGMLSIQELRMMLLGLFLYCSFGIIPKSMFYLHETSKEYAATLMKIFEARLKTATGIKDDVLDYFSKGTAYEDSDDSERFYKELYNSKQPVAELAATCLGISIPVAGNVTQQTALLVDLYLRDEYAKERNRIHELSLLNTAEADSELMGFIREGMRLSPTVVGLPRVLAKDIVIEDGEQRKDFKAGDKVLLGISQAHMDPVAFPNPTVVDPHRPVKDYILLGHGLHYCFGARLAYTGMLAMIKGIFKLKNLRRAVGRAGHLVRIDEDVGGLKAHMYLDQGSVETPSPISLQLCYDADSIDSPTGDEAVKDIKFIKKQPKSKTKHTAAPMASPEPMSPPSTLNHRPSEGQLSYATSDGTATVNGANGTVNGRPKKAGLGGTLKRMSTTFRRNASVSSPPPA